MTPGSELVSATTVSASFQGLLGAAGAVQGHGEEGAQRRVVRELPYPVAERGHRLLGAFQHPVGRTETEQRPAPVGLGEPGQGERPPVVGDGLRLQAEHVVGPRRLIGDLGVLGVLGPEPHQQLTGLLGAAVRTQPDRRAEPVRQAPGAAGCLPGPLRRTHRESSRNSPSWTTETRRFPSRS